MICSVLLTLLAGQGLLAQPPMHRAWTLITGERTQVLGVRGNVAYFISRNRVGAVNLDEGKPTWITTHEDWTQQAILGGNEIFVSTSGMKTGRLLAYDVATGKERVLRTLPEGATEIAWHSGALYLLGPKRTLEAIDPGTGSTLWSLPLEPQPAKGSHMDDMALCGDVLVFAIDDYGWVCVNPATRKVLWRKNAQYATNDRPQAVPGGILLKHPHTMLVEPESGKVIWQREDLRIEFSGISGSSMIAESGDKLLVLNLKTGRTLHSLPGGSPGSTSGGDNTWLGNDAGVLALHDQFQYISPDGKVIWSSERFCTGWPVFADGKRMLSGDGDRLLLYLPGMLATAPQNQADRDALARAQAAKFELLDDAEQAQFAKLGGVAAEALIGRFVEWARESEKQWEDREMKDDLGSLRYGLLESAGELLDAMCGPEQTDALTRAIAALAEKSSYRAVLIRLLGKHGRQDEVMRNYVATLRKHLSSPDSKRDDGTMVQMVARSKDPQAVAFMIDVLANPKAPGDWRKEAFVHLPGTGGSAGISAVLAARDGRRPRMRWEDRVDVAGLSKRAILSELKDSGGKTWRLFHSAALGNGSDLYVASKTPQGWSKALFTGVYTDRTWTLPAPTSHRGVPMAKLLKSEWVKMFALDPSVRKDADGDGLTDLVEARLGTDPQKPDTDGDGLGDAVDPCPNAAPRPMGDREKVVAACVEARFYGGNWGTPAVIEVKQLKPFEMYGYHGPLLWGTDAFKGTLPKMYGTGMNSLTFHSAAERGTDWVEFGADGRSAITLISRYSGGLNGDGIRATLIKVGDDWFVTGLEMMYVS